MGIIYSCDRQIGVIFVVWDGEVTWDEWREQIHKLMADPDWPSISRLIADLQTVTNTSTMGSAEVDEAASIFGSRLADMARKRVAVIARDEFGKANLFGDLLSHFGVSLVVFNSLDTACLFLGIDLSDTHQRLQELRATLRNGK